MQPSEIKTAEQCPSCAGKKKKKWSVSKVFWTMFGFVSCWNRLQSLYDKYGKIVLEFFGFGSE